MFRDKSRRQKWLNVNNFFISDFSVFCVVETFASLIYQFISHINPWKMTRYISLNFLICSEIIYVCTCSGSSNSTTKTWYLSWILTRDSHQTNFSIPNLGRGPPGRGPRPTSAPRPTHSKTLPYKTKKLKQ